MKITDARIFTLSALSLLLFAVAFSPVFKILFDQWIKSEDYAHAFITLPIIAFMVWKQRRSIVFKSDKGSLFGLVIVLLSIFAYLVSLHAHIQSIASISMVTTIVGMLVYIIGFRCVSELSMPLLLLLLLIPIPSLIYSKATLPLQLKVSQTSEILLRLFQVPIFREGNVLEIPDKVFEVVQACSGMRSIISLVTLSLIIGFFTLERGWSKLILLLSSIPVAIFTNIIRLVVMVLAFHYYKFDLSTGTSHTVMGLSLFILALIIIVALQRMIVSWERRFKKS